MVTRAVRYLQKDLWSHNCYDEEQNVIRKMRTYLAGVRRSKYVSRKVFTGYINKYIHT